MVLFSCTTRQDDLEQKMQKRAPSYKNEQVHRNERIGAQQKKEQVHSKKKKEWVSLDSNQGPTDYESAALTN